MSEQKICDINRLPLGLLGFSNIRNSDMIYVDKTNLIYKIASQRSPIFFSRPRRFGKSLLINTLASLFENGIDSFRGLDIEKKWNDKTYKVVHLDFSRMSSNNPYILQKKLGKIIIDEFNLNGIVSQYDEGGMLEPDTILEQIVKKIQDNSTVLLIDEYDAPLTHHIEKQDQLNDIIDILNNFYATVKQYTDKFRLIFITGVTRASHVSIFSAFNNLTDLSLKKEYNNLLGFTKNDLEKYFDLYVENASQILNMSKDDTYKRLEQYYDGYMFSINANETVYNPWSILSFFKLPEDGFKNYWFDSGGISSIIMQYLKISDNFNLLNYENRKKYLTNAELSDRYEITNIPREILLFQSGYLTIKKESENLACLTFPNTEVEDSLLRLYLAGNNLKTNDNLKLEIDNLYKYIDNKDLPNIIIIINDILNDCVSILSKIFQDERSIRDIIYAALPQEINLQKIKERETLKGRSDLELITKKTHMVIEFKRTKPDRDAAASLKEAIEQLKSRNYGKGAYQDHVLYPVAMVISTEDKKILLDFCQVVG